MHKQAAPHRCRNVQPPYTVAIKAGAVSLPCLDHNHTRTSLVKTPNPTTRVQWYPAAALSRRPLAVPQLPPMHMLCDTRWCTSAQQPHSPHMKAGAMPLRASSAVLALAYTAIFMPRKPDTIEVVAPSRKETVENTPL